MPDQLRGPLSASSRGANLAQNFGERFDLDLVWSSQSISPELKSAIQTWAIAIDKALRRSAGAKMPSEWAKRIECWDSLKEIRIRTNRFYDP
jgi:hypothetical protein